MFIPNFVNIGPLISECNGWCRASNTHKRYSGLIKMFLFRHTPMGEKHKTLTSPVYCVDLKHGISNW